MERRLEGDRTFKLRFRGTSGFWALCQTPTGSRSGVLKQLERDLPQPPWKPTGREAGSAELESGRSPPPIAAHDVLVAIASYCTSSKYYGPKRLCAKRRFWVPG